jgi:hypothetical protein
MIDAHLKKGGGACVCARCFAEHGTGLGQGKGQLYERTQEGWLLIAGGPDEDTDRRETLKACVEATGAFEKQREEIEARKRRLEEQREEIEARKRRLNERIAKSAKPTKGEQET